MDITYQEEAFEDILEEIKPILLIHWKELANHQDVRPMDPDYEAYIGLNKLGFLKVLTARENGKLIGYAWFVVSKHLHYKTWQYAVADIYYLIKERRNSGIGTEMFKAFENILKDMGMNSICVQEKTKQAYGDFFPSLGYKHVENLYEKAL